MLKLGLDPSISQWQVACFAADCDLVFFDKVEPGDRNPLEVIWASRNGETQLHFIDDPLIDLSYLALVGVEAEQISDRALESSSAVTLCNALDRVESDEDENERLHTASLLGVLAPVQYEPAVFEAFQKLFASPSAAVRRRAVMAASYPAWPEFQPLLKQLSLTEADPEVRERAKAALKAFELHGIAGSGQPN